MSTKVKGEAIKEGSIPLNALASGGVLLKNMDKGNPYFYLTEDNVYYESPSGNVVYLSTDKYPGVLELVKYSKVRLTNGPSSEVTWDDNGIKIDGNASYYNIGILFSANPIVPVAEIPDWNAQEGEAGYIKNKTHHVTSVSIETTNYTFIENIPKRYEPDSDIYYLSEELHIQYNEDDYIGIIKIPMNTPLGYEESSNRMTITAEDTGEEFIFSSYSDTGNIYFKVENPKAGTDFKILLYTRLKDYYLPNTILKTTPQTLFDEEKNQALANLGIDPVVWKYLVNPFIIGVETECYVPEELVDLNSLFLNTNLNKRVYIWKYLNPAMYVGYDDMDVSYYPVIYTKDYDDDVHTLSVNDKTVFIDENFKVVFY